MRWSPGSARQPHHQGLYSSLFGVIMIRSVGSFIDTMWTGIKHFPVLDYKSKVLKNAQICFYLPFMLSHSSFCSISNVIMWDTFVLAIVLRSIYVIESIRTVAVLA